MDIGTVLRGLYASEIDAGLTVYRRGTFWWVGGDFNEECIQGTEATAEQAAQSMHEAALKLYPYSRYVRLAKEAPPARVLTPEMVEAVHQGEAALSMQPCRCAEGFVCSRCQGLRALRAAFGIEGGTK